MKKFWIVVFVALIIGYGFGSVIGQFGEKKPAEADGGVRQLEWPDAVEVAMAAPDGADVKALEKERDEALVEVAKLRAALDAERSKAEQNALSEAQGDEKSSKEKSSSRRSWSERWKERQEQMKKENPEAYAAHQKRVNDFQEKMDGAVAEKSAFLVNLDTSGMTEEEKADHEELLGRVAEAWKLMNGMQEGKWPSREEWGGVRENMSAIQDLYAKERDYVLRQVGTDLGYDAEESQNFSVYMQDIFEKTSPRIPMPHFRGFGGRRSSHNSGGDSKSGSAGKESVAE